MKKEEGIVSTIAQCSNCTWQRESRNLKELKKESKEHVKFIGHTVAIQVVNMITYNP